jgi:hypothetical protein
MPALVSTSGVPVAHQWSPGAQESIDFLVESIGLRTEHPLQVCLINVHQDAPHLADLMPTASMTRHPNGLPGVRRQALSLVATDLVA